MKNINKFSSYEGHETWTNSFRMTMKMHSRIFILLLLLFLVLSTAYIYLFTSNEGIRLSPRNMVFIFQVIPRDKILMLFIASIILHPVLFLFFRNKAANQSSHSYIRGAKLISVYEFNKEIKKKTTGINLGLISMPVDIENRTTVFIGKPGTGKTQAMRRVVQRIKKINGQALIYDTKGDYATEFYDPNRDLIFNPLDSRSLGWNVFNDLVTYMDVDAQAASLVPPSKEANSDPFWNDAAKAVYAGIVHYLYQNNLRNNKHLWKMLTADAKDIAECLKETKGGEAGHRFITQNVENSRQAESVLAVMMQYTRCFEYMAKNEGDFSITNWLKNNQSGIIFITNYEDIEETLRPILSLFIDLMGRKLLSLGEDLNRRVYLLLDEFGSLQRLNSIIKLITKGRSKGAATFIGIQDDGQLEKTYGRQLLRTLDNSPGNRITFALSGEAAERESKYNIGDTEYYESERSQSMGPHDMRDGINIRKTKKKEPLYLPSDISNLQDLTAIVKLRGHHFVKSTWQYQTPKIINNSFALREDLLLENIVGEQKKMEAEISDITVQMFEHDQPELPIEYYDPEP